MKNESSHGWDWMAGLGWDGLVDGMGWEWLMGWLMGTWHRPVSMFTPMRNACFTFLNGRSG